MSETTKPPPEFQKAQGYHWLVCERASSPSLAEWMPSLSGARGFWSCIGESIPVTPEELARRGWDYWGRAKIPPGLQVYLDR